MEPFTMSVLYLVIIGFIIAFILAFGIGANDVANSFGTSVGSKVLTLKQACWLATVCEISGAVLLGYKVSDTIRKGILDVSMYQGSEKELMLGCLAALSSSAVWLLAATFLKLPISGTHSIVGSTIGFSLVARGMQGLNWGTLGTIVLSWFVSPILSGIMSTALFWCLKKFIICSKNPLRNGLMALPFIYGITLFINVSSIVHDGPALLKMDNIPTWMAFVISFGVALLMAAIVQAVVVPMQRRRIMGKPVQFIFGDSDAESSPGGSPKHGKRPLSVVDAVAPGDTTQLPAITEMTEFVSIGQPQTPNSIYRDPEVVKNGFPFPGATPVVSNGDGADGVQYKINPDIIKKAEGLLGKSSLDNTDLTVTSLNYIDEHHQNTLNTKNSPFSGFFERQKSSQDTLIKSPLASNGRIVPDLSATEINGNNNNNNNGNALNNNKLDLTHNVESAASLDKMKAAMSTNSSRVPLILGSGNEDQVPKATEPQDVTQLFSGLQVLTAVFGSFAHGGNDVSNAIGPLIGLYLIFMDGSAMQKSETPLWLLIYGGIGIAAGLWIWGRRVIQTVGSDLTKITPTTGFTIEIGSAMTVLFASKLGIPISTTHCKVGSVVFVGYANASKWCRPGSNNRANDEAESTETAKAVDWGLFRNIVYAWIITVPIAGVLSAGIMYLLMTLIL